MVDALLDSGSMTALVSADLVETEKLDKSHGLDIICTHEDTRHYSTVIVHIQTDAGSVDYQVGVVASMAYPVILG